MLDVSVGKFHHTAACCDQVHIRTFAAPPTLESAADQTFATMLEVPMNRMNGRRIAVALMSVMIGSTVAAMPRAAAASDPGEGRADIQLAQYGCQMFGPFATMRRANEVANEARSYGRNAIAFHNGDGYYVRAC
jgi:hypothetical protein